ncbi:MAG: AAA family ATPase [archaeon]|nr:AAA family ATPase [archaeon]MCR4324034.1 AAA family ATPase [Nanoarchaeota archaeon]
MLFKKLKLRNIRSYENLEIVFPKGSVLLAGDIGSGKTSILLGLQFALFGLQPGQKGASILRQGEDEAYAGLELEIDGELVVLERTIKKSKNGSISQDSNIITIGSRQEELSTSEMKDRVIRLLNYPKEFIKKSNLLYKFTVYTPQEEMKEIIQERPEVRLDTLRHIFGIDRYKRIKENVQIFLQNIRDSIKIKEVLVLELNLLKEKFNLENERKILLAREANNLKIEYQTSLKEKTEKEERVSFLQKTLEEKRKIDSDLGRLRAIFQGKKDLEVRMKKEIVLMQNQLGETVDFSESRLKEVLRLLEKHRNLLDERNEQFLNLTSRISVLESQKETPLKLREKIISIENCPTCFQKVGEEHKDKISKRTQFDIEEINRELEIKFVEKRQIVKEIEVEKELVKGYETDKTLLQQNKIKLEHQRGIETKIKSDSFVLDRTLNEVAQLRAQIEELEIKLKSFENSQEAFDKAEADFDRANDLARVKEISLATRNKELEILKERLVELQKEIGEKEVIREQINYLRGLQDWLGEKFMTMINLTEKNVLAKLRNEFSTIFSEWFSMLVSDLLSVRLDEDFTPIISNQDYEIDYEFLSGGERTATALAYRLSLNQVLNSMLSSIKTKNVVILDEPTDGFATEQIDKMRDIFDQLRAEQIILVSHEEKIEGFVDHVIRVKKEGISRVEG